MSDSAFLVYHIHWNIITIKLIVTVTYLKKKAILLGGLITYPFFFLWIWQKKKKVHFLFCTWSSFLEDSQDMVFQLLFYLQLCYKGSMLEFLFLFFKFIWKSFGCIWICNWFLSNVPLVSLCPFFIIFVATHSFNLLMILFITWIISLRGVYFTVASKNNNFWSLIVNFVLAVSSKT